MQVHMGYRGKSTANLSKFTNARSLFAEELYIHLLECKQCFNPRTACGNYNKGMKAKKLRFRRVQVDYNAY